MRLSLYDRQLAALRAEDVARHSDWDELGVVGVAEGMKEEDTMDVSDAVVSQADVAVGAEVGCCALGRRWRTFSDA